MATGFSTQSELWPSACWVDEPSKPHSGSCSSVGNSANSLICVLPRRLGTGVYPSSQMYSSLYFVIVGFSPVDDAEGENDAGALGAAGAFGGATTWDGAAAAAGRAGAAAAEGAGGRA